MSTVRLDPEDVTAILDRLDADEQRPYEASAIKNVFPYRRFLTVQLEQSGGAGTSTLVPSRALSCSSLYFLYGGYLHNGTPCLSKLITTFGSWVDASGKVSGCTYVEKTVHHVIVRFARDIHPPLFAKDATTIHALVVDDCEINLLLAAAHLQALRVVVDTARDGKEAVEKTMASKYDIILMDIEMPEVDGRQATRALREAGYYGIIVAISAHSGADDRERCLAAGCNQFLSKPYDRDDLSKLLSAIQEEPLYSSLGDDRALTQAINEFVKELQSRARAIEKLLLARDMEGFYGTVNWLRANSASFGFPAISDLAARIRPSGTPSEMPGFKHEDALRLVRLCFQARPVPSSN